MGQRKRSVSTSSPFLEVGLGETGSWAQLESQQAALWTEGDSSDLGLLGATRGGNGEERIPNNSVYQDIAPLTISTPLGAPHSGGL